jgi:hypothetical protein
LKWFLKRLEPYKTYKAYKFGIERLEVERVLSFELERGLRFEVRGLRFEVERV